MAANPEADEEMSSRSPPWPHLQVLEARPGTEAATLTNKWIISKGYGPGNFSQADFRAGLLG